MLRKRMRIRLTSIFVDDQDEALRTYTEVLGFAKKHDFPVGQFKWLTVVSPEDPDGTELLLEPSNDPTSRAYKEAIFEQGIPAAAFEVDDIDGEYRRLYDLGVRFTQEPVDVGSAVPGGPRRQLREPHTDLSDAIAVPGAIPQGRDICQEVLQWPVAKRRL
jgi:catechol 2,3-dioxygenase-like lactoylglutathione lyase family enzyme